MSQSLGKAMWAFLGIFPLWNGLDSDETNTGLPLSWERSQERVVLQLGKQGEEKTWGQVAKERRETQKITRQERKCRV